jgi:hypothetical protein
VRLPCPNPYSIELQRPMTMPENQNSLPNTEKPPSYVKLAMRNMVRQGGKSLFHFTLSAIGLLGLFVGLAYLTR